MELQSRLEQRRLGRFEHTVFGGVEVPIQVALNENYFYLANFVCSKSLLVVSHFALEIEFCFCKGESLFSMYQVMTLKPPKIIFEILNINYVGNTLLDVLGK